MPTENPNRFGSIDIGSNTLRLLIADRKKDETWQTVQAHTRITRLSGDFDTENHLLATSSMDRTAGVLADYAKILKEFGVTQVKAAATGICRKAVNASDFVERIATQTGLKLEILSGDVEAELSMDGARLLLGPSVDRFCFLDIGGSSTELSVCDVERRVPQSLQLGVVELTERHVKHDPPTVEELSVLFKEVHFSVESGLQFLGKDTGSLPETLVGTAGTVTTIAAMVLGLVPYDGSMLEGSSLTLAEVAGQLAIVSGMKNKDRLSLPGLEKGREDVIIAGMVIVMCVMEQGGYKQMVVTEGSLLEGLLLAAGRQAW